MMRILAVDDDPVFREILESYMDRLGYPDVTYAMSGPEALKSIQAAPQPFDCFLCDIEMPGMNGFDFAKAVRGSRWEDVPMVALSSHTSPRDLDRGREAGFNDYVAKDDRDALLQTLSQTIGIM